MLGNTVKTFRGIIVARVPLAWGIVVIIMIRAWREFRA